jgi:hypothetical protein
MTFSSLTTLFALSLRKISVCFAPAEDLKLQCTLGADRACSTMVTQIN